MRWWAPPTRRRRATRVNHIFKASVVDGPAWISRYELRCCRGDERKPGAGDFALFIKRPDIQIALKGPLRNQALIGPLKNGQRKDGSSPTDCFFWNEFICWRSDTVTNVSSAPSPRFRHRHRDRLPHILTVLELFHIYCCRRTIALHKKWL